jgi:hypothetical protein
VSSSDDDVRHKKVVIENDGDTLQEYISDRKVRRLFARVFPGNCTVGEWDRDSRLIRSVSLEFSHVAQRARPIKDRVLSVSSCWVVRAFSLEPQRA